jgi:F0F1-type ATP synthase assembly protein I
MRKDTESEKSAGVPGQRILVKEFVQGIVIGLLAGFVLGFLVFS